MGVMLQLAPSNVGQWYGHDTEFSYDKDVLYERLGVMFDSERCSENVLQPGQQFLTVVVIVMIVMLIMVQQQVEPHLRAASLPHHQRGWEVTIGPPARSI